MPALQLKRSRADARFIEGAPGRKLRKLGAFRQEVELKRPGKEIQRPWPSKQLYAFGVPGEKYGWGDLLEECLTERGWKFQCPCTVVEEEVGSDEPDTSFFTDQFEALLDGHPMVAVPEPGQVVVAHGAKKMPNYALLFMDSVVDKNDFSKMFLARQRGLYQPGRAYNMMAFPGSDAPLFKCNISRAFRNDDFYPRAYILPQEMALLQKDIQQSGKSYWIAKPNDDFGGTGITVWSHDDKGFQKLIRDSKNQKRSIVQRYLHDPYLIGGFKFHMRIHMVITSYKPLRAYVHEGGQVLCSTRPYTLSKKTLNKNFDRAVHLTNQCFNANPVNKDNYLRAKPVIGTGQQITIPELEKYIAKHDKGFDRKELWKQVVHCAKRAAEHISSWPTVKKNYGKMVPGQNFDIFGMDLMLDRNLKVHMCETNNMPGLCYPDKKILGEPNPDYSKEARMCRSVFHDTMALLGHDSGRKQTKGSLNHWYECNFTDEQ